jgi:uncharacterized small protein (DUF1192 family)
VKIIEGMKKIKDLQVKAEDLKGKIKKYHAHPSYENPTYGKDQGEKIKEWSQGYSDILKEILKTRIAIQKTNINTPVTIELGGKQVTKSIAEWIHRRRDLARLEFGLWECFTDKGIQEGKIKRSDDQLEEVKIVRYYSPSERDERLELLRSEPSRIDSTLEVINAVTDLEG